MARSRRREPGRRDVKRPDRQIPPFYFETTIFLLLTNEHVEHLGWAGVGAFYWLPTAQNDDDHRFDDTHPKIPTNGRPASPLRYASNLST